ncbi:phosphoribosylanthranilate isomerase [Gemmatimonas sp.]|uniref:phosphoribosylanthranilate isomerase n=1 Tax=Gemmatimonas sp. TaxID=1962908 RepID=UPI0031C50807|nr:phosphoribosylanthranilate isomerase [Gemmatimonas sp.]
MDTPRVKICCIMSEREAATAIVSGASALGLVSHMPSGPGVIDDAEIARIVPSVPAGIETFLLTSLRDTEHIAAQHARCGTTTLQLVDHLPVEMHERLRTLLPGVRLVQVVHVLDEHSVAYARECAGAVDALLLDSGNPALAVQELGGTGRTHDWQLSRRIRDAVAVPVYLAGGLNADNVGDAIATVRPYGLDLCSGVRSHGRLDVAKLHAFMNAVRAAGTP